MRPGTETACWTGPVVFFVTGLLLWQLPSCGGRSEPAPATTTSTTSTTTTTTTTSTTLAISTTTTAQASASYAKAHRLWSARGCTGCHTSGNLVLTGSASAVCATIRNGTDRSGGQYLDEPACSVTGSSIIRVPATGRRPNGSSHPGGTYPCFGSGGTCRQTILAWCAAGAGR